MRRIRMLGLAVLLVVGLLAVGGRDDLHGDSPQERAQVRPVRADSGTLTATGTVVTGGSRVGFTEAVVTDGSGAVVATATSTLLVFDV